MGAVRDAIGIIFVESCLSLAVLMMTFFPVLQLLMGAVRDAIGIIFAESYLSLAALVMMFLMAFGFASAGGVGASPAPAGSTIAKFARDEDSIRSRLALR